VVVSPGSRSAPLAYAVAAAGEGGGVGGFGGFWAIAFPIAQGLEKICIHYKYRIYIEIIALTR